MKTILKQIIGIVAIELLVVLPVSAQQVEQTEKKESAGTLKQGAAPAKSSPRKLSFPWQKKPSETPAQSVAPDKATQSSGQQSSGSAPSASGRTSTSTIKPQKFYRQNTTAK